MNAGKPSLFVLIVGLIPHDVRRCQLSRIMGVEKPFFELRRDGELMMRNVPTRGPKAYTSRLRTLLGLALLGGGILGFLPVLGFWMIPLGVLVIGLDVAALRRAWRRRTISGGSDRGTCDRNSG